MKTLAIGSGIAGLTAAAFLPRAGNRVRLFERALVVAEFDDSALVYVFGQKEAGIPPASTAFEAEFQRVVYMT